MNGASLCTGYGGLDSALLTLSGGQVLVYGENSPAARTVLSYRTPHIPNVGDIVTADWSQWAGRVTWLTAGWPCQPFSAAGRQKGAADERAIWPAVARAIRELGCDLVFLENVDRIASRHADGHVELARVLGDLAALGFDAEWRRVAAADAGAPHRRRRIFILAWHKTTSDGQGYGRDEGRPEPAGQQRGPDVALGGGATAADPGGSGLEVLSVEHPGPQRQTTERGGGAPVADSGHIRRGSRQHDLCTRQSDVDRSNTASTHTAQELLDRKRDIGQGWRSESPDRRSHVEWGPFDAAIRRWELIRGTSVPEPTITGARGGRKLSPFFVEWMMGLPAGWVTEVPGISINDQLALLGNGVVPAQAWLALRDMVRTAAVDLVRAGFPVATWLWGDVLDRDPVMT